MKKYTDKQIEVILESAELDLTEKGFMEQDEAYWYVGVTAELCKDLQESRPVAERVTNLLAMKEQVVDTLRTELEEIRSREDVWITGHTRAVQIRGQLGQLEYEVKMLRSIVDG